MELILGQILQLNREAVSYLKVHRNRDAYTLLNQGLRAMLDGMRVRQPAAVVRPNCSSSQRTRQQTQKDRGDDKDEHDSILFPVELSPTQSDMLYSPDNFFQLYDKAFLVSYDVANSKTLDQTAVEDLVAATMMYNIGLLCHRQGVVVSSSSSSSGNSSKLLRRALYMYEMAANTLMQQQINKQGVRFDSIFLLALTNNMGHIHAHFFENDKVLHCRRLLQDLLDDELVALDCVEDATPELYFFLQCLQFREFPLTLAPAA